MTILLVGCPGPEDRKKLEVIASFEEFIDQLLQKIGPDLEAGTGFSLEEEGGEAGTLWSLSLTDYMVRPLAQPADSWLADIHFNVIRTSEKCSPDSRPIEVYADFIGDATQWTLYSVLSRFSSPGIETNKNSWRFWERDSEDWKYLNQSVTAIQQRKFGTKSDSRHVSPVSPEVSE